ncbi:transcription factor Ouib-like [Armigeres subalbatus]|uniref:transcription factor Ouib-like n=1 Tax=Armigeres subalbatus TaxID=124917 RepID=UPI002ED411B3
MSICRVCGQHSSTNPSKSLNSFDPFADIYLQLTAVQLHAHEDIQLLKICKLCIGRLKDFEEFRNDCLKVHWGIKIEIESVKIEPVLLDTDLQKYEDETLEDSLDHDPEPFEEVGVSVELNEDFISEEDVKPQTRKRRAKYGSLKKPPPPKPTCEQCSIVFPDAQQLNAHQRIHKGLLPFVCETCNVGFSSLLDMQLHNVQQHTEGKTVPCDHSGCTEIFTSHQALRSHKLRVHDPNYVEPEVTAFICEICANSYTTKESLKRHRYSHVPDERPNVCTFCPRKFSTVHALNMHLNRHNGIKNQICPYCGVRKTTRNELRSHINNIHKKEQPLSMAVNLALPPNPFGMESLQSLDKSSKPPSKQHQKRTLRKQNRNSGKAYISSTNVLIPGKSFPENFDCKCPRKCPSLFSSQAALQEFFNSYWDLADWHKQNVLLQEMCRSVEIVRRRSRSTEPSPRTRSFHYFIPDGPNKVRVCKGFFIGILQISWGRLYRRVVKNIETEKY